MLIFCRANFEFDLGGGDGAGDEQEPSQRRQEKLKPRPQPDTTCTGIHQDLYRWITTLRASGPVSMFFQRQITCCAVICCLYVAREVLRKLQMLIFPDDPPPPDMAYPVLQCGNALCSGPWKSAGLILLQADS